MKAQLAKSKPAVTSRFRCEKHGDAQVLEETWLEQTGVYHA